MKSGTRFRLKKSIAWALLSVLLLSAASCVRTIAVPDRTVQTAVSQRVHASGVEKNIPSEPPLSSLRASRLKIAPSREPPGSLEAQQTPQFVILGFDDNTVSGYVDWLVDALSEVRTADGSPARATFYFIGSSALGAESWKRAYDAGHECGNHTFSHPHGIAEGVGERRSTMGWEGWQAEIQKANIALERLGMPRKDIVGFRQPYLEHSANSLYAAFREGFAYNLWTLYGLTGQEFSAILKYNLDLRIAGNRCPMTFGAHTDEYGDSPALSFRREALLDFIAYAAGKECVRIVPAHDLAEWLGDPSPL